MEFPRLVFFPLPGGRISQDLLKLHKSVVPVIRTSHSFYPVLTLARLERFLP